MADFADVDHRVRMRAFAFLEEQSQLHGDVLPRKVLQAGFVFEGQRVPLISPQGIFQPKIMSLPLTITTVPPVKGRPRPYEDRMGADGRLEYRYRGTNLGHRDNVGLREAMRRRVPLIYLYGVLPGKYIPAWPVFVVGDSPSRLCFAVQVDDQRALTHQPHPPVPAAADAVRTYVTVQYQRRVHQQAFRLRVLAAYREMCAVCRLRHEELLEAAHILPDGHPRGEPIVPNGLSLCRLHHGAFDQNILGIRPDHVVEIRSDILEEKDGPMLIHGLQGFQGKKIIIPHAAELQPNPEFLEERYEAFRQAG